MSRHPDLPIAIVGGGATGLAAAHALHRAGRTVRLFESSDRVGGAVWSTREGPWLIERGPNSVQETPELRALIETLGLGPRVRRANPAAKKRFILRRGVPVVAPLSPPGLLTTPLFSFAAKLRMMSEVFKTPRARSVDLSLADFIRSHFGREAVDYALNPFVSGVYAGDPNKLSARYAFPTLWAAERSHGSILRAQIAAAKAKKARGAPAGPPPIISFDEGLETLIHTLAGSLPVGSVEREARVETLVSDGAWKLIWSRGSETHTESFDRVLLTLPAAGLARLTVGTLAERPLAELEGIEYPPVTSVFLGFRREDVAHPLDGFGMLVPQKENRQILGVLFSSSLFPGRAPEGHVALTVMCGGAARPDLGRAPLERLQPIIADELRSLLGVTGAPQVVRAQAWPRAIPQYTLGYGRYLDAIANFEQDRPGLLIGGHLRDGISLPACLAAGQKLAERALA